MQNKKATIKPITKNDNKYFQKDEWKKFEKNNIKITRNVLFTKNEKKNILPTFQKITQIVKNKSFF